MPAQALVSDDLRLIDTTQLRVDESALTGELATVAKHAGLLAGAVHALDDRLNMAFRLGQLYLRRQNRHAYPKPHACRVPARRQRQCPPMGSRPDLAAAGLVYAVVEVEKAWRRGRIPKSSEVALKI